MVEAERTRPGWRRRSATCATGARATPPPSSPRRRRRTRSASAAGSASGRTARMRRIDIVGDDEADPAAGRISFSAPLARALIGACVGDSSISPARPKRSRSWRSRRSRAEIGAADPVQQTLWRDFAIHRSRSHGIGPGDALRPYRPARRLSGGAARSRQRGPAPAHRRWRACRRGSPIPGSRLPKTYLVQVEGEPGEASLEALRRGVRLKDGPTRPAEVEAIAEPALWPRDPPVRFRKSVPNSWLRLTIREGRNRQVRRMTAAVGLPTLRLVRWRISDWTLDEIQRENGGKSQPRGPDPASSAAKAMLPSIEEPHDQRQRGLGLRSAGPIDDAVARAEPLGESGGLPDRIRSIRRRRTAAAIRPPGG